MNLHLTFVSSCLSSKNQISQKYLYFVKNSEDIGNEGYIYVCKPNLQKRVASKLYKLHPLNSFDGS